MINKVILIGNLGKDPDIKATSNGKELANLTLATSESWKDKQTGERKEKTEWHRIVVFSEGLVNYLKRYVNKGDKLYIEGQLQTRKWQDSNGEDKYSTEVVLQGFNAALKNLTPKPSNAEDKSDDYSSASSNFAASDQLDDEIPF